MPRTVHHDICILELREYQSTGPAEGSENSRGMSRAFLAHPVARAAPPQRRCVAFYPATSMAQLGPGGLLGQPSDDITWGAVGLWLVQGALEAAPGRPSPSAAKACRSAALYKSTLALSCNF